MFVRSSIDRYHTPHSSSASTIVDEPVSTDKTLPPDGISNLNPDRNSPYITINSVPSDNSISSDTTKNPVDLAKNGLSPLPEEQINSDKTILYEEDISPLPRGIARNFSDDLHQIHDDQAVTEARPITMNVGTKPSSEEQCCLIMRLLIAYNFVCCGKDVLKREESLEQTDSERFVSDDDSELSVSTHSSYTSYVSAGFAKRCATALGYVTSDSSLGSSDSSRSL